MKDFREQNFYELLEVDRHASQQQIEQAYRRARRIFDTESVATYALFTPEELLLLRRRLEEAWRVLTDPERRALYDQELDRSGDRQWESGPEGHPSRGEGRHAKEAVQPPLPLEPPVAAAEPEAEKPQPDHRQDTLSHPPAPEPMEQPEKRQLPPMPEIGDETRFDGQLLRQVRLARGLTLEKIADQTKISIYYLRNIESEDFANLPAPVYVRGYLKQIAALLGLDVGRVVRDYTSLMQERTGK